MKKIIKFLFYIGVSLGIGVFISSSIYLTKYILSYLKNPDTPMELVNMLNNLHFTFIIGCVVVAILVFWNTRNHRENGSF